jgi:hypothetical protein
VGHSFGQPLGVELLDAYGNLAAGGAVTFTMPLTGASAINANGSAPPLYTYSDSTGTTYAFLNANSSVGTYKVVASLSASSLSNAKTVTFSLTNTAVPPPPPPPVVQGFTLTATPAKTTFSANGAASSQLVIVPQNGFSATVSLSCSAPAGVSCSFAEKGSAVSAKAVAVPANANAPLQLTVQQADKTPSREVAHQAGAPAAAAMAALFALICVPGGRRWRAHLAATVVLCAVIVLTGLTGCGSQATNTPQMAEAISITVTGTAALANGTVVSKTASVTVEPYIAPPTVNNCTVTKTCGSVHGPRTQ